MNEAARGPATRRWERLRARLGVLVCLVGLVGLSAIGPAGASAYVISRTSLGYVGEVVSNGSYPASVAVWGGTVRAGETGYLTASGDASGGGGIDVGWRCGTAWFGTDWIGSRAWIIAPGPFASATLASVDRDRLCEFWMVNQESGGSFHVARSEVRLDHDNTYVTPPYTATPAPTGTAPPSSTPGPSSSFYRGPSPSPSGSTLCTGPDPSASPGSAPVLVPCATPSPSPSSSALPANTCTYDFATTVDGTGPTTGVGDCAMWPGDTLAFTITQVVAGDWAAAGWYNRCGFYLSSGSHLDWLSNARGPYSASDTVPSDTSLTAPSFMGQENPDGWVSPQGGECHIVITWAVNGHHAAPSAAPSASASGSGAPSGSAGPVCITTYSPTGSITATTCPTGQNGGIGVPGDGGSGGTGPCAAGPLSGECKFGVGAYAQGGDCPFPDGSLNPLDYFGWIGCNIINIPIALGNMIRWAINAVVDLFVPSFASMTADAAAMMAAISGAFPFSMFGDMIGAVSGGAGSAGALPRIPLPGGGSIAFPSAEITAAVSPYRGAIGAGAYLVMTLGCIRLLLAAVGVSKGGGE